MPAYKIATAILARTLFTLVSIAPALGFAAPNISISDVEVPEGAMASFVVSIDARPTNGQTINLQASTQNGSAIAGQDYNSRSRSLSFSRSNCRTAPCSQTFNTPTINDSQPEQNEVFNVLLRLTSATNTGAIAKGTGVGTIRDNDTPANTAPSCSIVSPGANVTVNAGQALTFTGSASDPDGNVLSYTWSFPGGTPNAFSGLTPGAVNYSTAGTYVATFNVNDGRGGTCQQTRTVTVTTANSPPACKMDTPAHDVSIIVGASVNFTSSVTDPNGDTPSITWTFGGGTPASSSAEDPGSIRFDSAGQFVATLNATDGRGGNCQPQTRKVTVRAVPALSINSTSENSLVPIQSSVLPQSSVANSAYTILAINDLGMHCTDLDARVANILPPFQVLLSQIIQKGTRPVINPANFSLAYSAVANTADPILGRTDVFNGIRADGTTFKGSFADVVSHGAYDAFYPGLNPLTNTALPPLSSGGLGAVTANMGLPVPNVERLYIGSDGTVRSGDETLEVAQHGMPGRPVPYLDNAPQPVLEHYLNKPFFTDPAFKFGYVASRVNWFEGAGIPLSPFDDAGRENPFPLIRLQAKNAANAIVSTVDTVLPVSAEASCSNCHSKPSDVPQSRSSAPTDRLAAAGLPVVTAQEDPDQGMPEKVSREWAADINILRLHDLKHGTAYLDPSNQAAPCTIDSANINGSNSCLTHRALVDRQSVVCQTCHYTPALDLAQLGPLNGPVGSLANGRSQTAHQTNSRVMHHHHGQFTDLFPDIPAAIQNPTSGTITNQAKRTAALENSCYQCHPGNDTKCLRGAMFNGGVLCSDCHGSMEQIGNDFSRDVSVSNPGRFILATDFYNPASTTPRIPWANEPGCGSCHTGDANSHIQASSGVLMNLLDSKGNKDGIRLRQAFRIGDPKATPIVPTDKRFAEPAVPASFQASATSAAFANPGAGNPQLYRVSTGHGGVMCEGCHGPTHAEWPVANDSANDNVTAKQLQGHSGTIIECGTCHTTSGLSGSTQSGPHGMHLVNDSRWISAHESAAKTQNRSAGGGTCGSCHGADHLGTVLSRVPVDRNFRVEGRTVTIPAGKPVGCNLCHSLSDSFDR